MDWFELTRVDSIRIGWSFLELYELMEYVIAVVVLSWLDDLHDKSIHISQLRHPQHPKLASLLLPLLLWWLHRLAGAGCSLRFLRRWLVLLVVGG